MTTPTRPCTMDRTMSSPLFVNTVTPPSSGQLSRQFKLALNVLTPPPSPRHARSSSDLSYKTDDSLTEDASHQRRRRDSRFSMAIANECTVDGILICPYDVQILKDQRGRSQEFGYGAWSTVYRATCYTKPILHSDTPPSSPVSRPPVLVAVKHPSRNGARAILGSEGKVLTHLMREEGNQQYIIQFYGILLTDSSLIMAALPLSLEDYIKRSAVAARARRTTANMCEPVIGSVNAWLDLAHKLVSALFWLHEHAMVIHGDIKPGNILLDTLAPNDDTNIFEDRAEFQYEPVFADFSSSQRLDGQPTPNTLSAITREYTAPELLSSKVLSNPNSTATKASDVFSLAVTLLVAATGNTMVYNGSVFQRQAMATQGWMVVRAVRNGPMEEGARVTRPIERALEGAVIRDSTARISATRWKARMEEMISAESSDA